MFKIYDGRTHFWQWDTDCKLVVEDSSIQQVHFCNRLSECSLVCLTYKENEQLLVNVPNILFQSDRDIHVYAYNGFTKYEECFKIFARCKPSDYVYTETEVTTWEQLDERITVLEKGGVSEEALAGAIADYFVAHPIEDELTDYAKKTDVATAVSDKVTNEQLSNAIADFITESEVDNKISAIDMSRYALKSEIPDVSNLATKNELDIAIARVIGEIPDVSAFVTETQMNTAIQDALSTLVDGEAVSY